MQRDNDTRPTRSRAHALSIEDRSRILITDVEDVESFNETEVLLMTGVGGLSITGEGLHISRLNLDEGQLVVEGLISGVEYEQNRETAEGGFFSRIFR